MALVSLQPELNDGEMYEPLLQWRDGYTSPGLLESCKVVDKGHRWLLTLRENERFHDGSLCTVEHVVEALERLRRADHSGSFGMGGVYEPYLSDLQL